jgi:hypothetical protein
VRALVCSVPALLSIVIVCVAFAGENISTAPSQHMFSQFSTMVQVTLLVGYVLVELRVTEFFRLSDRHDFLRFSQSSVPVDVI